MNKRLVDLEDLFRYLSETYSLKELAQTVVESFDQWAGVQMPRNKDRYLRYSYLKDDYDDISAFSDGRPASEAVTMSCLVQFVDNVGMSPGDLLLASANRAKTPFDRFIPGQVVRVCIPQRVGRNAEGASVDAKWARLVHGARDTLAIGDLTNVLGQRLHVKYELDLISVPPVSQDDNDWKDAMVRAEATLEGLIKVARTGAIVSLGTGPHNVVSNAIARRFFDDSNDDLPVYFRWPAKSRRNAVDFLREPKKLSGVLPKHEAGIWYRQKNQWFFLSRDTDSAIVNELKKNGKVGPCYDCGLLAIDMRKRVPIVLAAGHGGNATRACVQALAKGQLIAQSMNARGLKGRFFGCVVVHREKPTQSHIDDLRLPKGRRGWYLFGLEDPPERPKFPEYDNILDEDL